ncbi:hypothetical protein DPEC_G00276160 [Dallia pectoralis]|uniref:Uncharacterized protein n=1 Tax=Dallia pectoralis TaxID=75939 RepID=A0ACC2FLU8_DALPE|nr:hypothetical protein DPEC_G00276160 [Dallia pectoralis]
MLLSSPYFLPLHPMSATSCWLPDHKTQPAVFLVNTHLEPGAHSTSGLAQNPGPRKQCSTANWPARHQDPGSPHRPPDSPAPCSPRRGWGGCRGCSVSS